MAKDLYKGIVAEFSKEKNVVFYNDLEEKSIVSDGFRVYEVARYAMEQIKANRQAKNLVTRTNETHLKCWNNRNDGEKVRYTSLLVQCGDFQARLLKGGAYLVAVKDKYLSLCGDIYEIRATGSKKPIYVDAEVPAIILPVNMDFNTLKEVFEF